MKKKIKNIMLISIFVSAIGLVAFAEFAKSSEVQFPDPMIIEPDF